MRLVTVDEVAGRLKRDDTTVEDAIRQAQAKGLPFAGGSPPRPVCLKAAGGFGS